MHKAILGLAVPLLLLAACEMKVGGGDDDANDMASVKVGEDGNVAITANDGADGVSVSVPGFDAKVKVPGIDLGSDNMDIGGMKLFPGSKVAGINVTDQKGPDNSLVEMRFTSPAAPDKVAAYYAAAARDEDYSDIKVSNSGGKAVMTGTESDGDKVMITMEPAAGGTAGVIVVRGQK